jgi:hypothetical protein
MFDFPSSVVLVVKILLNAFLVLLVDICVAFNGLCDSSYCRYDKAFHNPHSFQFMYWSLYTSIFPASISITLVLSVIITIIIIIVIISCSNSSSSSNSTIILHCKFPGMARNRGLCTRIIKNRIKRDYQSRACFFLLLEAGTTHIVQVVFRSGNSLRVWSGRPVNVLACVPCVLVVRICQGEKWARVQVSGRFPTDEL